MDVVRTPPNTPTSQLLTRAPLRLRLGDPSSPGTLDGAWWPGSRDFQTEVAELVDHFPETIGQVCRLLFSRPDWDGPPALGHRVRTVLTERGRVSVASFPSDDTQLLLVTMTSGRRLRLQVIASDSSRIDGERLLEAAGQRELPPGDGTGWDRWDGQTPWG